MYAREKQWQNSGSAPEAQPSRQPSNGQILVQTMAKTVIIVGDYRRRQNFGCTVFEAQFVDDLYSSSGAPTRLQNLLDLVPARPHSYLHTYAHTHLRKVFSESFRARERRGPRPPFGRRRGPARPAPDSVVESGGTAAQHLHARA